MLDNKNIRLPAEWEEQSALLLVWPHIAHAWWGEDEFNALNDAYIKFAYKVSKYELIKIIAYNSSHITDIKAELIALGANLDRVEFTICLTNDVFVRDTGPITVLSNKKPLLYDFEFNAWGGKYECTHDNALNQNLVKQNFLSDEIIKQDFILEGGSIDSNGEGILLTTESCLLSETRNNLSKEDIELKLKELFNLKQVLWLKHGRLIGDDTDGHIDTIARFINKDTICYHSCNNKDDLHYNDLKEMEKELHEFKTDAGESFNLVPIPIPSQIYDGAAKRLPASYLNFIIINNAIILPIYNCDEDKIAYKTLQQHFPDRVIVPIDATALVLQYGSLHCASISLFKGE